MIEIEWSREVAEEFIEKIDELDVVDYNEEAGEYTVKSKDKVYFVKAIHNGGKTFEVSCTCDYFNYKKRACKHIVKVLYDARMKGSLPIPTKSKMDRRAEHDVKTVGEKAVQSLQTKIAEIADSLDTHQIVIDLTGSYEDLPMIYEFVDNEGNKKVVVSWYGYTKAALLQGNIMVEFVGFEKTPTGELTAVAKAIDLKRNVEMYGVASRLPKTKTSRSFTYEILASKAARNALKKVLDPDIVAKVIEHAKNKKSVQEIPLREVAEP